MHAIALGLTMGQEATHLNFVAKPNWFRKLFFKIVETSFSLGATSSPDNWNKQEQTGPTERVQDTADDPMRRVMHKNQNKPSLVKARLTATSVPTRTGESSVIDRRVEREPRLEYDVTPRGHPICGL